MKKEFQRNAEIWQQHIKITSILLGLFFTIYFARMLPFAQELYGVSGVVISSRIGEYFPELFFEFSAIYIIFILALISSLFFLLFQNKWSGLIVFIIYWLLNHRNILTMDPSKSYLSYLLLAILLAPLVIRNYKSLNLVKNIWAVSIVVMAVSYFYSGVQKSISPNWRSGAITEHLITGVLAFPHAQLLLILPQDVLFFLGRLVVVIHLIAPFLLIKKITRFWGWLLLVIPHIFTLLFLSIAEVSIGMLIFHYFTAHPGWIKKMKEKCRGIKNIFHKK